MAGLRSTFLVHFVICFIFSQLHVVSSLRTETALKEEKLPAFVSQDSDDFCRRTARDDSQDAGCPQASTAAPAGSSTDGLFQDVRLIGSFALGIAFMHVMEVVKPGNRGAARKFELYPYVL
ncbi:CNR10 [Symbiodinium sp. CCMP2592]|nr:CNR10 [Symbiodinium sp. CCMP2592]